MNMPTIPTHVKITVPSNAGLVRTLALDGSDDMFVMPAEADPHQRRLLKGLKDAIEATLFRDGHVGHWDEEVYFTLDNAGKRFAALLDLLEIWFAKHGVSICRHLNLDKKLIIGAAPAM